MKRLAITGISVLALALAAVPAYAADSATPSLSFWSGQGAKSHWQNDKSDSGDPDTQDIELATTDRFGWAGYAGFSVTNLDPTPVEDYGASSFEVKSSDGGGSLGSARLVVQFSDGGSAELRPETNSSDWQLVGDGAEWDNNGGSCGYRYAQTWQQIMDCHVGADVVGAYMVADAYGLTHWIDSLQTAGVTFNSAQGNGS